MLGLINLEAINQHNLAATSVFNVEMRHILGHNLCQFVLKGSSTKKLIVFNVEEFEQL